MIDMYFKNKRLNIRTTAYHFFVIVCLFVRSKTSGHSMLLGPEIKHLPLSYSSCVTPISNVEIKNIKSAG